MSEVLTEKADGVGIITLNRPDTLNAVNAPLAAGLREAIVDMADDSEVRCVVITGAGKGFCAGGDRNVIQMRDARQAERGGMPIARRIDALRKGAQAYRLLHDMGKPTIAMINGACAGMGMSMAGACDFRYGGHSALMTTAFAKTGISGDSGGSWYWTQILGTAKARRLYLLSEKFKGEEAYNFGLLTELFADDELRDRTMAIASQLAAMAPGALRFAKEALNSAEEGSFTRTLDYEAVTMTLSGLERANNAKND